MKRILTMGALIAAMVGCASAAESPEDPEANDSNDALSSSAPSYVSVRRDPRRCASPSPKCGGYYVHELNGSRDDRYVSGFDLSALGLDPRTEEDLHAAPKRELVLYGSVGEPDRPFGVRAFVVTGAYLGMPGVSVAEGASFYTVGARSPKIVCIAAPCPNEVAQELNRAANVLFDGVRVVPAARPLVDQDWLATRVLTRDAVVAGTFAPGAQYPAGKELLLVASQVFVRLPDRPEPCPRMPLPLCDADTEEVMTFRRNSDRCLVPTGCAKPGLCPMVRPVCGEGYVLESWRSGSAACFAHACDPTFAR